MTISIVKNMTIKLRLFYQHQTLSQNSNGVTPCEGDKYRWGIKISNGTNFNDIEWPLTPISRSRYYSMSNNSQTVQDRAIVTMATNKKSYLVYRTQWRRQKFLPVGALPGHYNLKRGTPHETETTIGHTNPGLCQTRVSAFRVCHQFNMLSLWDAMTVWHCGFLPCDLYKIFKTCN